MPTTGKILKGDGHQVTNTAGTNERFAGRAVCREGGVRSWKRWAPWKTHWGKRASYYLSFNVRFLSPLRVSVRSCQSYIHAALRTNTHLARFGSPVK